MNSNKKKDVIAAMVDGAVLFFEHEGRLSSRYTQESDYVLNIVGISNLAERIVRTSEKLFSIQKNRFNGRKFIASTKVGDLLIEALKTDVPSIRKFFPHHDLNPYFELFVHHAQERGLDYCLSIREAFLKEEITRASDALQGFVNALREEGRCASFKAKLRRFMRGTNKNGLSLNRYLRRTLERQSAVNILRLDLSYQSDATSLGIQNSITSHRAAKDQREAFLKALKKSETSRYLVGYAWKMENSFSKGFLHHLLLILDEESVDYQSAIIDHLRKIWDEVTASAGLLVDYSTLRPSFKSEGAELLDKRNKNAWATIRNICTYLTQTDTYIKLNLPGGGRAFGRAEVIEKRNDLVVAENGRFGGS